MPHATRNSAYSGCTDGACPQIDTVSPAACARVTISRIAASTAGSRSSYNGASRSLSRSTPSTSCVRSFDPIDTASMPIAA